MREDRSLDSNPVTLVVAGVLAKVNRGDLQDLHGGLAIAARGGASPLVDLGACRLGLLSLGEGLGRDGAERQERHQRSRAVGRHLDGGCVLLVIVGTEMR